MNRSLLHRAYCFTAANVPTNMLVPPASVCVPVIVVPFSVPAKRHVVEPDAEPTLKPTIPDCETEAASIVVKLTLPVASANLGVAEPEIVLLLERAFRRPKLPSPLRVQRHTRLRHPANIASCALVGIA